MRVSWCQVRGPVLRKIRPFDNVKRDHPMQKRVKEGGIAAMSGDYMGQRHNHHPVRYWSHLAGLIPVFERHGNKFHPTISGEKAMAVGNVCVPGNGNGTVC